MNEPRYAFDVAIDRLRESLAIVPRPATAFNLALALRGAGRLRDAITQLDALLEGEHGALRPEQRGEAETLRREAAADLATLRIHAHGAPAIELRVDGERIERSVEGVVETRVDPGEHVVTASAPDHATVERRVRVMRGAAAEIELVLGPLVDTRPGTLIVESTDPSLIVEIVGVARATGTLERALPAGRYDVRVISGRGRRDSQLEVPAGRTVRLSLEPPVASVPIAEEPWLWITVSAVVLVGGGIAVGAGVAASEARQPPITDPIFGVVETLAWSP